MQNSATTSKAAENEIALQFFEITRGLTYLDDVASAIVNTNHGSM
jgi:hypothetical protein